MTRLSITLVLACLAALAATAASTQEAQIAFGGLSASAGQPVEITADQFSVAQADSDAVFEGNVLVVQGGLRLSSDLLTVVYAKGERTRIERLLASGNVLLSTPTEAAQATGAVYALSDRTLEMTGDVVLTQNGNVMSGERLIVDIDAGTGRMDGRVRTLLQPAGN